MYGVVSVGTDCDDKSCCSSIIISSRVIALVIQFSFSFVLEVRVVKLLLEMIERADSDQDGQISFDDFYTIMTKKTFG